MMIGREIISGGGDVVVKRGKGGKVGEKKE